MHNPTSAAGGCLIGVLRRLLFSGTLPTHPSSHQSDHETTSQQSDANYSIESPAPNLVARLMGLDSMPQKPHDSIRSANSADCDQEREPHLLVKTSVEIPTFLDQENDDYLVLSFENVIEEPKPKQRKSEMGFGRVKRTRAGERENKENRPEKVMGNVKKKRNRETEEKMNKRFYNNGDAIVVLTSISPLPVATLNPKQSRRRRRKKKTSSRRGTIQKLEAEDWSPVSVLDFGQLYPQFLPEEGSRSADSNSRRKLEPKLEKYEQPSPSDDQETEAKQDTFLQPSKQDRESYMDMWGLACRLAEEDTVMESNWSYRKVCSLEDLDGVCKDLQIQLLDQLCQELVLEL